MKYNLDYMKQSVECVKELHEKSRRDPRLSVVSKGVIFTPTFFGYEVVRHNIKMPSYHDYHILAIDGVYCLDIEKSVITNRCNFVRVSDDVETVFNRFAKRSSYVGVYKDVLCPLSNTEESLMVRLFHSMNYRIYGEPKAMADIIDSIDKSSTDIYYGVTADGLSSAFERYCGFKLNRQVAEIILTMCYEGFRGTNGLCNVVSFMSYCQNQLTSYGRLYRNNILINTCMLMSQVLRVDNRVSDSKQNVLVTA